MTSICANILCRWLFLFVLFSITPFKGQSHTRSEFFTKKLTISSDSEFSAVLGNSSFLTSVPSLDVNYLDTVPVPYDTARKIFTDTPLIPRTDTLLISKDSLDAPIQYSAEDSGVLYVGARRFVLYGKANTKYTDINLESNTIIYDQASQMLKAYGGVDSADAAAFNKPKFIQGGTESIMDTLYYNIKTQKGLTKNTYYKEGELFVNALVVKKVSADVAYAYRGRFTTCNLDTPHFAIRARKLKMINNKIAVSGPAFPEFEMVPMPIGIPFGIYPLSKGRRTGLLPPQFAQNESFGLGLEGLGYYKVINEYWDVTTRANIYSYGGWRVDINPRYFKRYKYNGNLQLSIQRTKILNTGGNFKDEFTINRLFQINWSHRSDSKARPGTSFSANVAAGSTQFNNFVANNAFQNFNNQLQSSINYNKSWNEGKMNLSVSATHNQNSTSRLVSINLPNINFAVATIYPFQPKEQVGAQKWYEKLGVSYNTSVLTQASFYDSLFNIQRVLDTVRWGARHSVPISLALPALGPFILSPSISFDENWYSIRTLYGWNEIEGKIDTTIKKGFFAARDMSFGLSANTRIFGTIQFKRGHIMGIRHEIKPFISASFSPDLVKQYNTDVQIDTSGRKLALNQLQGNVVGAFSGGTFGGISFGIDNLLEMKVKDKKDTSAAAKKLRIIDGLNITSSYNFLVDSLQLSPFNISFRSSLIENMNITGGANIDPYEVDSTGIKINSLLFRQGKPGRLTNINLALSTRFQSKKKEDDRADEDRIPEDEMMTLEEQQRQLEYIRQNPADFVDFNIPWSLSVSFSLRYDRVFNRSTGAFDGILNSNVNLNGDLSITPKWKLGGGTFFDFKTRRIQTVSMFITREMHCWQMAINIQVGQFKSFNITLNPKSGILRDLRINKRFLQQ